MKNIKIMLLFAMLLSFVNVPVNSKTNYLYVEQNEEYDGYIVLDYENATQVISENRDIDGTIPLIIYNADGSRNISMGEGKSIVSQGGVVTGNNNKLYKVPYVPVYC